MMQETQILYYMKIGLVGYHFNKKYKALEITIKFNIIIIFDIYIIIMDFSEDETQRIAAALKGKYTPVINAIIAEDKETVHELLEKGESANKKDESNIKWSPMKWASFIYEYGDKLKTPFDKANMSEIIMMLKRHDANSDFDSILRPDKYNFTPVLLHDDIEEEQYRRDLEEQYGGRRVRKTKKTKKSRKTKKSANKKGKTTKRRKNMKK